MAGNLVSPSQSPESDEAGDSEEMDDSNPSFSSPQSRLMHRNAIYPEGEIPPYEEVK